MSSVVSFEEWLLLIYIPGAVIHLQELLLDELAVRTITTLTECHLWVVPAALGLVVAFLPTGISLYRSRLVCRLPLYDIPGSHTKAVFMAISSTTEA